MLQIKSDAQPLRPGGKDWGNRFPSHNHNSGYDRIPDEKAEREKHSAITETSESGHQEISPQLTEARPVKYRRFAGGTKAGIHKVEASKGGYLEEGNRNDCAGEKFSYYQNLSSHRHEKLIMESAFNHFAAEYPGKDPHAGEEDSQPEIEELDYSVEDLRILLD